MIDLREIYQETILDHYRRPRNFSELDTASHQATGHNPLCGDRVQVFLQVDEGVVKEVTFKGAGCAISTASASLMTEAVKGKPLAEVEALFKRFHTMVTTPDGDIPEEGLGKLEALSGVRRLPVRVKCATLAWHTMRAALKSTNNEPVVSTE